VSLGIQLHNEQKDEEMLKIMDHIIQKYIPTKCSEKELNVNGIIYSVNREISHQILCGGEKLTVARFCACQLIQSNSTTESKKLSGIVPVVEDWRHTKVILLEVTYFSNFVSLYTYFIDNLEKVI
jgi:hypothetical protein